MNRLDSTLKSTSTYARAAGVDKQVLMGLNAREVKCKV